MEPTDALFDAINRGDIGSARDAISRGADLHGQNILGMTPMELSVDLGRNDISFLLLSMRGADDGRNRQPPATTTAAKPVSAKAAKQAARSQETPTKTATATKAPRPHSRPRGCSAATAARRSRMRGSWGSTPAATDSWPGDKRNFI